MDARRCAGCERMTYDCQNVALLVQGQLRLQRELCAACRSNAIDGFAVAKDGLHIREVTRS
jgi:hypothetical protein